MEYLSVIVAIFSAHVLLMITPGPNVLLIAQVSATQSRMSGLRVALGVGLMGFIWPTLAIVGLSVVFQKIGGLYIVLKIIGALYLMYLGYKTWHSASQPLDFTSDHDAKRQRHFFKMGFFTSLSNPKVLVFMGSFFTAMLPIEAPVWLKVVVILIFGINSLWWHTMVAYAFSTNRIQKIYARFKGLLERITGGLLVLLGLRLMIARD